MAEDYKVTQRVGTKAAGYRGAGLGGPSAAGIQERSAAGLAAFAKRKAEQEYLRRLMETRGLTLLDLFYMGR